MTPRQVLESMSPGRLAIVSRIILSVGEMQVHYAGGTWEGERVQPLPHHVITGDDPRRQIAELRVLRSDLGKLDVARIGERWHIVTHAGSRAESDAWVLHLNNLEAQRAQDRDQERA